MSAQLRNVLSYDSDTASPCQSATKKGLPEVGSPASACLAGTRSRTANTLAPSLLRDLTEGSCSSWRRGGREHVCTVEKRSQL